MTIVHTAPGALFEVGVGSRPLDVKPSTQECIAKFLKRHPMRATDIEIEMEFPASAFVFQRGCHWDARFGFAPALCSHNRLAQTLMKLLADALVAKSISFREDGAFVAHGSKRLLERAHSVDIRLDDLLDPLDLRSLQGVFAKI